MSNQQSQRVCRNVSPGATVKQGPMKATVPLALMQTCSPTRCLNNQISSQSPADSPPTYYPAEKTRNRSSPDYRNISPESQSPPPSAVRVEKSKPLAKPVSPASFIRRTASVDTIYLLGQWQRDALYLSYCGRLMMDRATQTPEEFEEGEKKSQKKTSASSSTETLEMKFIRQRLQRTNHNSRGTGAPTYQRHSPVHGDHSAITSASGGTTSPVVPSSTSISPQRLLSHPTTIAATSSSSASNNASATYSTFVAAPRALPIPIPDIPKPLIPRMRSSVEGLNQEIERLVLKEISSIERSEGERTLDPTPEGHRAPIADLFRTTQSVDTQTPFSQRNSSLSSNSSNSISPVITGHMDSSRPSSAEDSEVTESPEGDSFNKLATSPRINKFLAREPPDGCEKVKIAEEAKNSICTGKPQKYGCPKPSLNYVLLPSQRSAFYPLCKNCVMSTSDADHHTSSFAAP